MQTRIKLNNDIVTALKAMRDESGVLAKDVAQYIHKSPAYIVKLERGEIKSIDVDTLKGYLDITHKSNTTVEDLLNEYLPISRARTNKEFSDKIDIITEAIGIIFNGDADYALNKINTLVTNIKVDKCFAFAFMTLNLSGLKHLSYTDKENLIKEIKDLIEKYSRMSPTIDFFTDI